MNAWVKKNIAVFRKWDFNIYVRILKFLVRKLSFFRWLNTEKYEQKSTQM